MNISYLKTHVIVILLLASGALIGAADTGAPSNPPGVLYSTDFGTDPINATDGKWWLSNPAEITWVQDVTHSGKGSLKLVNTDKTKPLNTYGPFVPYTGPTVKVSVEAKLDGVSTGTINPQSQAVIAVYYYDSDMKEIGSPWPRYHDSMPLPDGTHDWQSYDQTFTLPSTVSGVAFLRIVVMLPGSGSILVDKVNVAQGP